MPPRAVWKGHLKIAELSCPVSLYTAVSSSDRIAFHTLNRDTGHRVHRQFIDSETRKPVEREDQVKGYDTGQGEYVVLEPEEVAAAVPDSDKALSIQSFVACGDIDDVFLDRPYFLLPTDKIAERAYALIRDGLAGAKVAALAQTVLFRRMRTVLVRAHDGGLMATLLNFDYEVRPARDAFDEVPDLVIKDEMLGLAEHIIKTKRGTFDPKTFDDRYEAAVADMVRAKIEGRPLAARQAPVATKVVDLMEALRASAGDTGSAKRKAAGKRTAAENTATPEKARSTSRKTVDHKEKAPTPRRKAS